MQAKNVTLGHFAICESNPPELPGYTVLATFDSMKELCASELANEAPANCYTAIDDPAHPGHYRHFA